MFRFPRVFWLVGVLAVLLSLPSVFADLYTDDQGMVLSIEGVAPPPIPGPFQLLPWGALFLAYAALYKALHYGVRNCGAYVDPIAQPLTYLSLLPTRLAVYLDAALLCVPSEISILSARATPILATMGVVAALLFMALLGRAVRELDSEQSGTLAWLFLGALLALLPGVVSMPGDRVLFLPNLALAPALSMVPMGM